MRKLKEMSESVSEMKVEKQSFNPDNAARTQGRERISTITGGDTDLNMFQDDTKPSHPGGGFIGRNNVRDRI